MVLSVVAAADVRRFGGLALVIAAGYVALIVGEIAALIWGGAPAVEVPLIGEVSATAALLAWMAIDVVLVVLFTWLWFAAARAAARPALSEPARVPHPGGASPRCWSRASARRSRPSGWRATSTATWPTSQSAGKNRVQVALTVLGLWPLLTARPPLADARPRHAQDVPAEALRRRDRRAARAPAAAARRAGADPHRLPDVLPRLLRRPRLVGLDRLHRLPAPARRPAAAARRRDRAAADAAHRAAAPALRHGGDRLRRGRRDPRLPLRGEPAARCSCSSAARTPTRAASTTTRSPSTCASTTRARSSSRPTSACRSSRACASAAARRSTTRSACPRRSWCWSSGSRAGSTAPRSSRRSRRCGPGSRWRRSGTRPPQRPPSGSSRRSRSSTCPGCSR